jgi:hypothetical protein
MNHRSRWPAAAAAACGVCMLAACTTPATAPDSQAAAKTEASSTATSETIVGSRIPRKTTERMVRATDAAGAKDMEHHRPPEPGQLNGQ